MKPGGTAGILSIVGFSGVTYFLIGLPLAVLPGVIRFQLGYGAAMAGAMIGLQYAATLLSRSVMGRLVDTRGAKTAVLIGLGCASINGVWMLAAHFVQAPLAVLALLGCSRIWLGIAESGTATGCLAWGIGRHGSAATAKVISWNGVASYGGMALGAPAGAVLAQWGGLPAVAVAACCLPLAGLLGAMLIAPAPAAGGIRMSMRRVAAAMVPYGLCLAGAAVGFGAIVSFLALYYAGHGWRGAAFALSVFGICFVLARIFLYGNIDRHGGFRPALFSLAVEAAGLALLWLAPGPIAALLGAGLSGFGFSLIYPALGVEALRHVSAASRGAAIGVYSVFFDLALGVTGPVIGLAAGAYGYPVAFLTAAAIVLLALGLTWQLMRRAKTLPA